MKDLEKLKFDYYDIYGYILAVSGSVRSIFREEFEHFKINKTKPTLYVVETLEKNLPLQQKGSNKGVYLPFDQGNIVKYEKGVAPSWIFFLVQHFIMWKDKAFLHCAAVSEGGKAIIFPATGDVGKTKTAMYLVSRGYEYLADEWLIIGENGLAYPFLRKTKVFDYNLKADRNLAKRLLGKKRFIYDIIYQTLKLIPKILGHRYVKFVCERMTPFFDVKIDRIYPSVKYSKQSKIDKVFWLIKDEKAVKIKVENTTAEEIADSMYYANSLELYMFYFNYYLHAYHNKPSKKWDDYFKENKRIIKKAFSKAKVRKIIVPSNFSPVEIKKIIDSN